MMIIRLLHWALRLSTLPAGHEPGCRAGKPAEPDEPAEIIRMGEAGVARVVRCQCDRRRKRPPTLYEAITGISNT